MCCFTSGKCGLSTGGGPSNAVTVKSGWKSSTGSPKRGMKEGCFSFLGNMWVPRCIIPVVFCWGKRRGSMQILARSCAWTNNRVVNDLETRVSYPVSWWSRTFRKYALCRGGLRAKLRSGTPPLGAPYGEPSQITPPHFKTFITENLHHGWRKFWISMILNESEGFQHVYQRISSPW